MRFPMNSVTETNLRNFATEARRHGEKPNLGGGRKKVQKTQKTYEMIPNIIFAPFCAFLRPMPRLLP
jgi:hypothetical protein